MREDVHPCNMRLPSHGLDKGSYGYDEGYALRSMTKGMTKGMTYDEGYDV